MFRLNQNKQKTNRNSLIESMFWYSSEKLGLFRFVSVYFETILFSFCFSGFDIGLKHKTNRIFLFLVSQNKSKHKRAKQILFRFFFVQNNFWFVSRTPYFIASIELS
jgi:hypothetical protein